jgi:hypothetical protein
MMASALIHVFNPLEVSEYIPYTVYSVHVVESMMASALIHVFNPLEVSEYILYTVYTWWRA